MRAQELFVYGPLVLSLLHAISGQQSSHSQGQGHGQSPAEYEAPEYPQQYGRGQPQNYPVPNSQDPAKQPGQGQTAGGPVMEYEPPEYPQGQDQGQRQGQPPHEQHQFTGNQQMSSQRNGPPVIGPGHPDYEAPEIPEITAPPEGVTYPPAVKSANHGRFQPGSEYPYRTQITTVNPYLEIEPTDPTDPPEYVPTTTSAPVHVRIQPTGSGHSVKSIVYDKHTSSAKGGHEYIQTAQTGGHQPTGSAHSGRNIAHEGHTSTGGHQGVVESESAHKAITADSRNAISSIIDKGIVMKNLFNQFHKLAQMYNYDIGRIHDVIQNQDWSTPQRPGAPALPSPHYPNREASAREAIRAASYAVPHGRMAGRQHSVSSLYADAGQVTGIPRGQRSNTQSGTLSYTQHAGMKTASSPQYNSNINNVQVAGTPIDPSSLYTVIRKPAGAPAGSPQHAAGGQTYAAQPHVASPHYYTIRQTASGQLSGAKFDASPQYSNNRQAIGIQSGSSQPSPLSSPYSINGNSAGFQAGSSQHTTSGQTSVVQPNPFSQYSIHGQTAGIQPGSSQHTTSGQTFVVQPNPFLQYSIHGQSAGTQPGSSQHFTSGQTSVVQPNPFLQYSIHGQSAGTQPGSSQHTTSGQSSPMGVNIPLGHKAQIHSFTSGQTSVVQPNAFSHYSIHGQSAGTQPGSLQHTTSGQPSVVQPDVPPHYSIHEQPAGIQSGSSQDTMNRQTSVIQPGASSLFSIDGQSARTQPGSPQHTTGGQASVVQPNTFSQYSIHGQTAGIQPGLQHTMNRQISVVQPDVSSHYSIHGQPSGQQSVGQPDASSQYSIPEQTIGSQTVLSQHTTLEQMSGAKLDAASQHTTNVQSVATQTGPSQHITSGKSIATQTGQPQHAINVQSVATQPGPSQDTTSGQSVATQTGPSQHTTSGQAIATQTGQPQHAINVQSVATQTGPSQHITSGQSVATQTGQPQHTTNVQSVATQTGPSQDTTSGQSVATQTGPSQHTTNVHSVATQTGSPQHATNGQSVATQTGPSQNTVSGQTFVLQPDVSSQYSTNVKTVGIQDGSSLHTTSGHTSSAKLEAASQHVANGQSVATQPRSSQPTISGYTSNASNKKLAIGTQVISSQPTTDGHVAVTQPAQSSQHTAEVKTVASPQHTTSGQPAGTQPATALQHTTKEKAQTDASNYSSNHSYGHTSGSQSSSSQNTTMVEQLQPHTGSSAQNSSNGTIVVSKSSSSVPHADIGHTGTSHGPSPVEQAQHILTENRPSSQKAADSNNTATKTTSLSLFLSSHGKSPHDSVAQTAGATAPQNTPSGHSSQFQYEPSMSYHTNQGQPTNTAWKQSLRDRYFISKHTSPVGTHSATSTGSHTSGNTGSGMSRSYQNSHGYDAHGRQQTGPGQDSWRRNVFHSMYGPYFNYASSNNPRSSFNAEQMQQGVGPNQLQQAIQRAMMTLRNLSLMGNRDMVRSNTGDVA